MSRVSSSMPLEGVSIVITRPVGQGRTLARQVGALGGHPVLLPGVALRAAGPPAQVRAALGTALGADFMLFTSPSGVDFAARVTALRGRAHFAAVGRGTARALARHGVREVIVAQTTQDSEGLLAHPALAHVRGCRVAVIGAPGGRGVLQRKLRERGAQVAEVWVYRRVPARLDARHRQALRGLRPRCCVLLSSAQTLERLHTALAAPDWRRLARGVAVVSSARVAAAARQAGFGRVEQAASALGDALLARAVALMAPA